MAERAVREIVLFDLAMFYHALLCLGSFSTLRVRRSNIANEVCLIYAILSKQSSGIPATLQLPLPRWLRVMALGILEPATEQVPGTIDAYQVSENDKDGLSNASPHSSAGPRTLGRITKVPHPSNDPNDPLVCETFATHSSGASLIPSDKELAPLAARRDS